MCWRPARPIRCANSSNWPSPKSAARSNGAARAPRKSAVDKKTGKTLVRIDPRYFRPTEVDVLVGDATRRVRSSAGTRGSSTELVAEMVAGDLNGAGGRWPRQAFLFELKGKTVYVAGHRGMVGSALVRRLRGEAVEMLTADRESLDLRHQAAVTVAGRQTPDVVFLRPPGSAALSPTTAAADFLYDNLAIETQRHPAATSTPASRSCCSLAHPASIRSWRRSRCGRCAADRTA